MIASKETQRRRLLQMLHICSFELQMLLGNVLSSEIPTEASELNTQTLMSIQWYTRLTLYEPNIKL